MQIPTKIFSRGSKLSSCASILGSWQICHSVCTSLIGALATIGIVVQGMPLLFLNTWQVPLWMVASALFGILMIIKAVSRMRCISSRSIVTNTGLLSAGLPFDISLTPFIRLGGLAITLLALFWYIKDAAISSVDGAITIDCSKNRKQIIGGLVGMAAVAGLFFISLPELFEIRGSIQASTAQIESIHAGARMKFTLFDIAHAKEYMDTDHDGRCDVCGMDIDDCIASGMMQCTMDPNANMGTLWSAHYHATFAIYKNGQKVDLSPYGHRMGSDDDGRTSGFIHVEKPDLSRLHMHATGIPLKFFFESIGMDVGSQTVQVLVNGNQSASGLDYVFKDEDDIEVRI